MKITFIVPSLNLSGGLRVVAKYAELFSESHQVTIVSPSAPKPTFKQQIKTLLSWNGYTFNSGFNDSYFRNADYQIKLIDGVETITDKHVPDADVVIATFWTTAFWVDALSDSKGAKFYFVQGDEREFDGVDRSLVAETYQLPLNKITISSTLQQMLQNDFNAKHVALVPNSIDHQVFHAPRRAKQPRPTVGLLFSETRFKGVKTALAVIARVKETIPDLQVMSFGSHLPRTMRLPAACEFTLKPEQNKLRDLYASCDVWLCCSLSEGFGLTVLEAMACRTPVVSTRCGGPEDFVEHNKSGYFADVDDIEALSEAVIKVLESSQSEWQSLSESACQTAKSHSWQQAGMLFEKALAAGVHQQKGSHHVL